MNFWALTLGEHAYRLFVAKIKDLVKLNKRIDLRVGTKNPISGIYNVEPDKRDHFA